MNVRASQRSGSTLIIVVRALLLIVAAGSVVLAFVVIRRSTPPVASHGATYTCAMHPEVTSPAPGECPICRMALEPKRSASSSSGGAPGGAAEHARADGPARFTVPPLTQDRVFADVMWVRERPVSRDVRVAAWVESPGIVTANFYRDELALLKPGDGGTFIRGVGQSEAVPVRVSSDPPRQWDAATSNVHLRFSGPALPIGATGQVRFPARTLTMLAVPQSAVLQGRSGPYVLVASADRHTFTKRPIEIGRVLYGYAPVLTGLSSGERIAVMETFFLDAERRLGAQSKRSSIEIEEKP